MLYQVAHIFYLNYKLNECVFPYVFSLSVVLPPITQRHAAWSVPVSEPRCALVLNQEHQVMSLQELHLTNTNLIQSYQL